MPQESEKPTHPGGFIREHIIPQGMSVTDAAKRLGVGRPALSNLLNANSSLSSDMVVRLGKTFGADRQKLLDLQAAFDLHDRRAEEKSIAVHAYVPVFLTIKAQQIQGWADDIDARHMLPVLLRKLVHSTGQNLLQVDFPGHDNAQRAGWDGLIEAGAAVPWIPEGKSCWEFGVNRNPSRKAESDYTARIRSVSPVERRECTFVFVTPRNWTGKTEWARNKNAAGDWKAVRVLDASDLEQWLEESIAGQLWLAQQLNIGMEGIETLDQCWARWAEASEPRMTGEIFAPSIDAHRKAFTEWLEKPCDHLFTVAADSKDEALAFLACLFQDSAVASRWGDLAAVFESAQSLRALVRATAPFIPIVCTEKAERELVTAYRRHHCIVVRPRNTIDSEPDISIDLLNHDDFVKALAAMGIERDKAEQLGRESGRSPTILRRRLSKNDAIRTPQWAGDAGVARRLIPMALTGAWHAKATADREVVETLSDRSYQEIEESITYLRERNDSPVWSVREYRGVVSKIDTLFAIHRKVTEKDLTDFFLLAEYVLSETDPALELPEDKRWAARLYDKVRAHSAALRKGVCETLVILSIHGNNLFRERLAVDVEASVSTLIHRLLIPLTLEKLLSHDNDLPRYAEAAPDVFLSLIETDLKQPRPVVLGLLKPVESGLFSGCPRTGLLWALECLAWNPQYFPRVSFLLAQLSKTSIDDNWMNKPIHSLEAIFRAWMPQTAASLEQRTEALEVLTNRFPDIGWQICIEQLNAGPRMGHCSYKPDWRSDASGAGQLVTRQEIYRFNRIALDLALAWPKHDGKTLGDLVERVPQMPKDDQTKVWDLIDTWANSEADEREKAGLRERIRRFALTQYGQRSDLDDATRERAHTAYANLKPSDSVVQHAWLFANHWVEFSDDDVEDGDFDHSERQKRIHELRAAAMKEIWDERGFEGVTAFLSWSAVADIVGASLALSIMDANSRVDFLRQCLSVNGGPERDVDGCMQGFLQAVDDESRGSILSAAAEGADIARTVRLFRCAPFGQNTWRLLDGYGKEIQDRYWKEVFPHWSRHSEEELNELIDRLLEANRPRAAFQAVDFEWLRIETSRLKRLLRAAATVDAEPQGHYLLEAYQISKALESLDARTGVSQKEMAQLEFLYIRALDRSEHGIPNLEQQMAESPASFVEVLALACKRRDHGQDPSEWRIEDPERQAGLALAALNLLDQVKCLPGTQKGGNADTEALFAWVTEARQLCTEHDRAVIGDQYIGQILARAPAEEDGSWPSLPVCEVMERIASPEIGKGFNIGVRNGRGVHWREEGGTQERDLAAKYRDRAQQRVFDYPYVSSVIESTALDYEQEAEWHDGEATIENRLQD